MDEHGSVGEILGDHPGCQRGAEVVPMIGLWSVICQNPMLISCMVRQVSVGREIEGVDQAVQLMQSKPKKLIFIVYRGRPRSLCTSAWINWCLWVEIFSALLPTQSSRLSVPVAGLKVPWYRGLRSGLSDGWSGSCPVANIGEQAWVVSDRGFLLFYLHGEFQL